MTTVLKDVCKIRSSREFTDSEKRDILKLADEREEAGGKRGLVVEFELSASFRTINGRLYTKRGQKGNIDSWMEPYPKAILVYHDEKEDPIGRFIGVEYQDNDTEAMKFFSDVRDYRKFKRVMDSDDPRAIYKELHKRNLLLNDSWPGLGRLVAKARISDEQAIEKFLDGRYLTFSAGSRTDRYACGICGSDWGEGDICEHRPGSITDEGEPAIFVTGSFKGTEASVVNNPANTRSIVQSMQFADSVENLPEDQSFMQLTEEDFYLTDAIVDTGDSMKLSPEVEAAIAELKQMDARDVARSIMSGQLSDSQVEAMQDSSHYATQWHIRVHDALHSEYEWKLRWDDKAEQIPDAVFSLHADIHDMSMKEGFRDSLVNGKLDTYSRDGSTSDEYVSARLKNTEDAETGSSLNDSRGNAPDDGEPMDVKKLLIEALSDSEFAGALRDALAVSETTDSQAAEPELEPIDLSDCDLWSLGMACRLQLGDSALDEAQIAELEDSAFLGEGRDFVVATIDHVEAARTVVEKARLSEDQRERMTQALDRRQEALKASAESCEDSEQTVQDAELQAKFDALQKDYQAGLELSTALQAKVDELEARLSSLDNKESVADNKQQEVPQVDSVKPVENPSEASSQGSTKPLKNLSDYERGLVTRYQEIKDKDGQETADAFIYRKMRQGHLNRSFDITQYISEKN